MVYKKGVMKMKKSLIFIILFLLVLLANCATEEKTIQPSSISQQKFDTPIWNVGDSWGYRYSDMKQWQYTVERIEEDSYIVDDYYGGYKNCFDRKTLQLLAYIDHKGDKKAVSSPWFIDFPIYVGKKWKKPFTSPPSSGTRIDVNYLNEYKVISHEDVTVPAGTFKAFKIELKQTNYYGYYGGFASGKAYSWYSPEVKSIIKTEFENIPYWIGFRNYALTKFELKDKRVPTPELELSPQKVDSAPKPQTPLLETPKISAPAEPKVQITQKATSVLPGKCDVPIWNIGDSWKFGNGEMKVIRVEENLYIVESSSPMGLVAYDKDTLEKKFDIDDKGRRVQITSSFPLYFEFPFCVGEKWQRRFSARPPFATRNYDLLIEYEVLNYEDITVSAGTFKAFKIEINHTNFDAKKANGKAHIWYSPEVKLFVKLALDGSSHWRGAQGYELMSFNLKHKETSPKEIKLPLEKVEIAPRVQPARVEKQQAAPPTAPSLGTQKQGVDIPSKPQPPVTEKKKVPAFAPPSRSADFVVVAGTSANIRTGAGNEFPIVTTVNQGAKLTLLGEYGKWFNVRLENGQEGWINSRFVQE
jgi:hypothetical protein